MKRPGFFRSTSKSERPKALPAAIELDMGGELDMAGQTLPVRLRTHPRARSLKLSLSAASGPVLTIPHGIELHEARRFLEAQRGWLARHLPGRPGPTPFADGLIMPLRGIPHQIVGTGQLRGKVEVHPATPHSLLLVPGTPDHLPRRLTDWLKTQARDDLAPSVARHAANLGVRPASLALRGQATRWGSCSSQGRLNFNWRLVLAPPFVLDYVAAHEVAHLVEMNHSAAFWATVARTLPDMDRGRDWLRQRGGELLAYGHASF